MEQKIFIRGILRSPKICRSFLLSSLRKRSKIFGNRLLCLSVLTITFCFLIHACTNVYTFHKGTHRYPYTHIYKIWHFIFHCRGLFLCQELQIHFFLLQISNFQLPDIHIIISLVPPFEHQNLSITITEIYAQLLSSVKFKYFYIQYISHLILHSLQ